MRERNEELNEDTLDGMRTMGRTGLKASSECSLSIIMWNSVGAENAGAVEGEIGLLVVDRSMEAEDGNVVIACVDGECTVKTLRKGRGGLRLEAANPAYKPIRFAGEMELRVFGVVTAVIHRFVNVPSQNEAE